MLIASTFYKICVCKISCNIVSIYQFTKYCVIFCGWKMKISLRGVCYYQWCVQNTLALQFWMYVDKSALVVFRTVFCPCVAAKPATAVESIVLNKTFSAAREYCSHLMLSTSLSVILRWGLDASTLTWWSSIHSKFPLPWVDLSQRH